MEDIESFVKVLRQKRLANQRELDRLDVETDEHMKMIRELQDLRSKPLLDYFQWKLIVPLHENRRSYMNNVPLFVGERKECIENITKHLITITSHKHSIHKIVHSAKDVSGLPVPHDYAQYVQIFYSSPSVL